MSKKLSTNPSGVTLAFKGPDQFHEEFFTASKAMRFFRTIHLLIPRRDPRFDFESDPEHFCDMVGFAPNLGASDAATGERGIALLCESAKRAFPTFPFYADAADPIAAKVIKSAFTREEACEVRHRLLTKCCTKPVKPEVVDHLMKRLEAVYENDDITPLSEPELTQSKSKPVRGREGK